MVDSKCHGVSIMTADGNFVDSTLHKATMWSGFRCSRIFPVQFIVALVIFTSLIFYLEKSRSQSTVDLLREFNSLVAEQTNIMAEMQSMRMKILQGLSSGTGRLERSNVTVFAITPTFARPVQKAELTRLSQTFLHVPNFHWIIVEDSASRTNLVAKFLAKSNLIYTHLNAPTPPNYKLGRNDPNWRKPRGIEQRNAALRWIREKHGHSDQGVVYFADDDNTYSIKLFSEMAKIKKVGVWPVGLVGGLMVEKPICDNVTNKVVGFNAVWKPSRMFPVDMAGFAVNLNLILDKDAKFSYETEGGYQETDFLEQLITRDELEPLADACTKRRYKFRGSALTMKFTKCSKVYVWHTRTEPPLLNAEQRLIRKGKRSNEGIEV